MHMIIFGCWFRCWNMDLFTCWLVWYILVLTPKFLMTGATEKTNSEVTRTVWGSKIHGCLNVNKITSIIMACLGNSLILCDLFRGKIYKWPIGGWTNPFEKYASVKLERISPGIGVNIKKTKPGKHIMKKLGSLSPLQTFTLPPIIMEVQNQPKWKETNIGNVQRPPIIWESNSRSQLHGYTARLAPHRVDISSFESHQDWYLWITLVLHQLIW